MSYTMSTQILRKLCRCSLSTSMLGNWATLAVVWEQSESQGGEGRKKVVAVCLRFKKLFCSQQVQNSHPSISVVNGD